MVACGMATSCAGHGITMFPPGPDKASTKDRTGGTYALMPMRVERGSPWGRPSGAQVFEEALALTRGETGHGLGGADTAARENLTGLDWSAAGNSL